MIGSSVAVPFRSNTSRSRNYRVPDLPSQRALWPLTALRPRPGRLTPASPTSGSGFPRLQISGMVPACRPSPDNHCTAPRLPCRPSARSTRAGKPISWLAKPGTCACSALRDRALSRAVAVVEGSDGSTQYARPSRSFSMMRIRTPYVVQHF
jgi:hypothetical protein